VRDRRTHGAESTASARRRNSDGSRAERRGALPAEYEQALQQILSESERTTVLIDNLLTLARADSGRVNLKLEPVDLSAAMDEPVAAARKLAEARGLSFEARLPDGACPVIGDTAVLGRLAMLLIDNAIKYTPAPGSVGVAVENRGDWAVLEVQDSGIGISPEDLPHIFERFYRADKARGRGGGAGLGLAIAKWIAEQHGAEIRVESTPAEGSTFRICLPLAGVRVSGR
jgi:signal transduction histidine kinase